MNKRQARRIAKAWAGSLLLNAEAALNADVQPPLTDRDRERIEDAVEELGLRLLREAGLHEVEMDMGGCIETVLADRSAPTDT